MSPQDKIKQQFISSDFRELPLSKLPKSLLWQPDLVFVKNNYTYLVLIKSNNSIPPTFLNRIANIPSGNIIPLIIFAQKVDRHKEKEILNLGISVGNYFRGRLLNLKIRKKTDQTTVKKEIRKKLDHIDIFVSSKQNGSDGIELGERTLAKKTINLLRDTRNYPFTAHLIEYERFKLNKLYEKINEVMEHCEWIVILLEDYFSKTVRYEINKAIKTKDHQNIFIFLKSTHVCKKAWKNVIAKITKMNSKSIKYLPYSDLTDLEVTMTKAINNRMNEICEKKKIQIYV